MMKDLKQQNEAILKQLKKKEPNKNNIKKLVKIETSGILSEDVSSETYENDVTSPKTIQSAQDRSAYKFQTLTKRLSVLKGSGKRINIEIKTQTK